MANSYGNNSISQLKGAETIRQKPASILGSDGIDGSFHTAIEIVANAIDEWREKPFDVIKVKKFADKSIMVSDLGRGIPLGWNEVEQKWNWELVFCTLYAGGKYNTNEGENYEFSLGTNGLGATASQFTSRYMNVIVLKDNKRYTLRFENGEIVGEMKVEDYPCEYTGTTIHWLPDDRVFLDVDLPEDRLMDLLKRQAIINQGIKIEFSSEITGVNEVFQYNNGITEYMEEVAEGNNFTDIMFMEKETRGKDREDRPEYKVKLNLAFCFNNENNLTEYYHNGSWLEHGGSPDRAVRLGFTNAIDKFIANSGKYQKSEKKITFDDVKESLMVVTNTFSTQTSYENQTKKAITNTFVKDALQDLIKSNLEVFFIENPIMADRIANQILANKRSREKANVNRQKLRKELEGQIGNATTLPSKYVPCRTKDKKLRRITVIEGDSALNAVKQARDRNFDAIFPLKGKPINCLKKSIDEIMNNDEAKNFTRLLGCGVSYKGKKVKGLPEFNIDDSQFCEINILSDGDEDGFHIRTLMIAMIYVLMEELIVAEMVKIVEAPLYRITTKEKIDGLKIYTSEEEGYNDYIAYDELEKNAILSALKDKKYVETRFKGLGGLNPQLSAETIMSRENRRVKVVTMNDARESIKVLEMFLDDDNKDRKEYIAEHGHKYFDYSIYEE